MTFSPRPIQPAGRLGAPSEANHHAIDPDAALAHITSLAARLLGTPIAAVCLVDGDRFRVRSCHGWETLQMEQWGASCLNTLSSFHTQVVSDLQHPPAFTDPPDLAQFPIRSYIAASLRAPDGVILGALCALDTEPRLFSEEQQCLLEDLAVLVMREMELGHTLAQLVCESEERKRIEERVQHLAHHDTLTGLPNRLLLKDRLEVAIIQAHRNREQLGVLFLDLDRFKVINDSLGHKIGDQLLKCAAERLKGAVRHGDIVARSGGDEFIVVLPRLASLDDVTAVAERIVESLRPAFWLDDCEMFVTTSIGASICPSDGVNAETLLKNADVAMYRAKTSGRNSFQMFAPTMNHRAVERLALETGLHKAFDNDEFLVHYQPQVNLETGEIVGMEALVRWQSPDRGLVPPGDFIPLAEETGLIAPLGMWVLRTACKQVKEWHDRGFPWLRVGVNLSLRQFEHADLVPQIARILEETGLRPSMLDLEITESIAMEGIDSKVAMLSDMKGLGLQLSLDDFGTGFSSLIYLKRLPVDVVKIDRSFIRMITADRRDAAIATGIIRMAHSLNLRVIAEGVETEEQWAFLRNRDCDMMQGFLFSPPVPAEAFTQLLMEGRRLLPPDIAREAA